MVLPASGMMIVEHTRSGPGIDDWERVLASGEQLTEQLADDVAGQLWQLAPSDTGRLAKAVSEVEKIPWGHGVGPIRLLGDPDREKPKGGTISAFLEKWRRANPGGGRGKTVRGKYARRR